MFSSQIIYVLRVEQNEFTTPAEINETFRNHFANLAEPKQNLKFNEEHDRQVKIDADIGKMFFLIWRQLLII
jgi:hypothetical protein